MSRQRLRTGVLEASTRPCPHCDGTGLMRTASSAGLSALRMLEDEAARGRGSNLILRAGREAAIYLLNRKRDEIVDDRAPLRRRHRGADRGDVRGRADDGRSRSDRRRPNGRAPRRSRRSRPRTKRNISRRTRKRKPRRKRKRPSSGSRGARAEAPSEREEREEREGRRRRRRRGRRGGRRREREGEGEAGEPLAEDAQTDGEAPIEAEAEPVEAQAVPAEEGEPARKSRRRPRARKRGEAVTGTAEDGCRPRLRSPNPRRRRSRPLRPNRSRPKSRQPSRSGAGARSRPARPKRPRRKPLRPRRRSPRSLSLRSSSPRSGKRRRPPPMTARRPAAVAARASRPRRRLPKRIGRSADGRTG